MLDSHAMYILDSASELGELTAMEYAVLNMDTGTQKAFNEQSEHLSGADGVSNFCRERLDSIPLERQYVMALSLMANGELEGLLNAYRGRVDFLLELKIGEDLQWRNPGAVSLWGDNGPKVFETSFDITEPNVTRFLNDKCYGPILRWQSDLALFQQAVQWAAKRPTAMHKALNNFVECFESSSATLTEFTQQRIRSKVKQERESFLKTLRAEQQRAKRAVKKAFKLFESQGKEKTVGLLISGSEVTVSHPSSLFKFVVKPHSAGWLLRKTVNPGGTTPFTLELYTKEDVFLSRLCVLFADTPVLDQLMALSLFIESGDEGVLLEKANWFAVEKEANLWIESNKPEYAHKVSWVANNTEDSMSAALQEYNTARNQFSPFEAICKQWVNQHLFDKFSYSALPDTVQGLMVDFNEHLIRFKRAQQQLMHATDVAVDRRKTQFEELI